MNAVEAKGADSGATVTFRLVILSIVALWLCYFGLTTVRGLIAGFSYQGELLWRRGIVTLVGMGMTLLVWLVLRLFDKRPLWVKIGIGILIAMPASIPIAQTNEWIFKTVAQAEEKRAAKEQGFNIRRDDAGNMLVDVPAARLENLDGTVKTLNGGRAVATIRLADKPTEADRWKMILDVALGRYFLLLAWASLYFAMLAGAQAQEAQRREDRFRSAAKAAELRSLRYQVNPHFLFNALNSLSALVMTDKSDKAEEMIQTLSRFYRHSLSSDPTTDVSLEDEFDLQREYLAIEQLRFPSRLRTQFDLPHELERCCVPGMILQPLIENSVKYGVSASNRPVTITIAAREEYGRLVITVADDGPGSAPPAGGLGIGLGNVRDRLQAAFGNAASVTSGPALGGYETELRIPLVRHG